MSKFYLHPSTPWACLMVKNLPAMQKTWIRSLGREEPLKKGMDAHSSTFIRISCTEDPSRL